MDKRKLEFMEKLDSIYRVVLQSSSKGISAIEIARKLGKPDRYRTTVHRYLNTLELMGKVRSEKGLWFPTEEKPTTISDYMLQRLWEEEKFIEKLLIQGKAREAYLQAKMLYFKLPKPYQERLVPYFKRVQEDVKNISATTTSGIFRSERIRIYLEDKGIPLLVYGICKILNEMGQEVEA